MHILFMETVLCAAVGTAIRQHGVEACTLYVEHIVCSCRHKRRQHGLEACTLYG